MKRLSLLVLFLSSILCAQDLPFSWGGDVRVKWNHDETSDYINYESNIVARLTKENAWVDTKIKVTLSDWIDELNYAKINLDRALLGYRFEFSDTAQVYAEVGHAKLKDLFESKLQHETYFNGAHIGYKLKNFTLHAGINKVTSFAQHYAYLLETSYHWDAIPLTLTYNFSMWKPEDKYSVSQLGAKYSLDDILKRPTIFYGAFLKNHRESSHSNAFYVGATLGEIVKAHDYLIDLHYHYASAYSIPTFDQKNLGNGVQVKIMYAMTDHFSFQGKMDFALENTAEVSAIYSW